MEFGLTLEHNAYVDKWSGVLNRDVSEELKRAYRKFPRPQAGLRLIVDARLIPVEQLGD